MPVILSDADAHLVLRLLQSVSIPSNASHLISLLEQGLSARAPLLSVTHQVASPTNGGNAFEAAPLSKGSSWDICGGLGRRRQRSESGSPRRRQRMRRESPNSLTLVSVPSPVFVKPLKAHHRLYPYFPAISMYIVWMAMSHIQQCLLIQTPSRLTVTHAPITTVSKRASMLTPAGLLYRTFASAPRQRTSSFRWAP